MGETPILSMRGPWGVPIEVAPSFAILCAILIGFDPSAHTLAFVAMIALSILLHELGHAWGNIVQGLRVERVVLWGGGGLCYGDPRATPREQELVVAMGPIVNLFLWALLSMAADHLWLTPERYSYDLLWALDTMARINLVLFALNMIPVQPLDGGRLLQLGLMRLLSRRGAARVAGGAGLVMAALWIPGMIAAWYLFGFVLLFFPSVRVHLQMLRGGG